MGEKQFIVTTGTDADPPTMGSLRYAINEIQSDNMHTSFVIKFDIPDSPPTVTLSEGTLSITKANVTINGNINGAKTTITVEAGSSFRVFIISINAFINTVFENLIIRDSIGGGAIENNGELTIKNCEISGNVFSDDGGAILNNGPLNIYDSIFEDNVTSSGDGGAIYTLIGPNITIERCVFELNSSTSGSGGAIYHSRGLNLQISESTFKANFAINGAAIANNGNVEILNSTFSSNGVNPTDSSITNMGGAIYNFNVQDTSTNADITAINCTFYQNKANSNGGAIRNGIVANQVDATLVNCTLFDNTPDGIYSGTNGHTYLGNTVVYTTGVANNTDGRAIVDLANPIISNRIGTTDPSLGILEDNGGPTLTCMPMLGPVLIAQGVNQLVYSYFPSPEPNEPYTDQRGFYRFVGTVDIGAVEFGSQAICFAANSMILTKNIQTGTVDYVKASECYANTHQVYSIRTNDFVPIKLNAITGPTNRFMLIPKDLECEGQPNEDFYVTSGHNIHFNGVKTRARAIPGAKRIKVRPPEMVYTICTEDEDIINVNNLGVYTMEYAHWLDYTKSRRIYWTENRVV